MAKVYFDIKDSGDESVGIPGFIVRCEAPFFIEDPRHLTNEEIEMIEQFKSDISRAYIDFSQGRFSVTCIFSDSGILNI